MSITNLLRQSATVYPKSGYNKFGRDVSGTGVSYACRFQNQTKTKIMPNQQVVILVGTFYFDGTVTVNAEDRIVYNGISYKAFQVNGSVDSRGVQKLLKVTVTKWEA